MDTWITGALNQAAIGNTGLYGKTGSIGQTGSSFGNVLQSQLVNRMKQEIYKQFKIAVGGYSDTFNCYIPSNVLCRMNTDGALKEKVFSMLEKYSGEGWKEAAEKCTLIFDEEGEMTATLETAAEKKSQTAQNAYVLYQKYLMQRASLMPFQMNAYSVYDNLYGLNGLGSLRMLSLFSSILGL
ncbi:MAG: hypothetical protein J6B43_00650 [Lachnospiraceae bacterium]|nr:hypothetical protein [Lachnospiraceae bacterium]